MYKQFEYGDDLCYELIKKSMRLKNDAILWSSPLKLINNNNNNKFVFNILLYKCDIILSIYVKNPLNKSIGCQIQYKNRDTWKTANIIKIDAKSSKTMCEKINILCINYSNLRIVCSSNKVKIQLLCKLIYNKDERMKLTHPLKSYVYNNNFLITNGIIMNTKNRIFEYIKYTDYAFYSEIMSSTEKKILKQFCSCKHHKRSYIYQLLIKVRIDCLYHKNFDNSQYIINESRYNLRKHICGLQKIILKYLIKDICGNIITLLYEPFCNYD